MKEFKQQNTLIPSPRVFGQNCYDEDIKLAVQTKIDIAKTKTHTHTQLKATMQVMSQERKTNIISLLCSSTASVRIVDY